MAPCLLIFEDLDSLVEDETRSYFLNEVDGLESNDGILMIGSTNHLDQLDPAISKRPSRFDRKYHFKVPNEEERTAYCQYWRKKLDDSDMVEFPEALCPIIAKMTEAFSFAYLKELFIIALLTIARGADSEDVETTPESPQTSDSSSSADGVVVEREDATIDNDIATAELGAESDNVPGEIKALLTTEKADAKAAKETKDPGPKKKKSIPQVEVPEALGDNLLLRVVRNQSQLLLDEMDNTDESEWPSGKKAIKASGPPDFLGMLRAGRY
jgi:transitional endoplasmic reticulum ATPase